jgi:hypothetical protein
MIARGGERNAMHNEMVGRGDDDTVTDTLTVTLTDPTRREETDDRQGRREECYERPKI